MLGEMVAEAMDRSVARVAERARLGEITTLGQAQEAVASDLLSALPGVSKGITAAAMEEAQPYIEAAVAKYMPISAAIFGALSAGAILLGVHLAVRAYRETRRNPHEEERKGGGVGSMLKGVFRVATAIPAPLWILGLQYVIPKKPQPTAGAIPGISGTGQLIATQPVGPSISQLPLIVPLGTSPENTERLWGAWYVNQGITLFPPSLAPALPFGVDVFLVPPPDWIYPPNATQEVRARMLQDWESGRLRDVSFPASWHRMAPSSAFGIPSRRTVPPPEKKEGPSLLIPAAIAALALAGGK